MSHTHLSDDRLIEIALDLDAAAADSAHLRDCEACESRRVSLAETLDDATAAMTLKADEAFSDERLEKQRARILQRVELAGRLARVIVFPNGQTQDVARASMRHARRWATLGGALAASFLIGLAAEHLAHDLQGTRQARPTMTSSQADAGTPRLPSLSDDELFGRVEVAAAQVGPVALIPLDALTPRAWDAR
jgi:GNAT superfamily N-acetyltransferase